jgi:2-iminobutanoate/2-iminopropanoate deaminase
MTVKRLPPGASQHKTAGPYSPVLEVRADCLVVISGQVSNDANGKVVGQSVEEQTRQTLANCQKRLEMAGCSFDDVFKVNAYLANIDDWSRFNAVYGEMFSEPRPVRTTVGVQLLPGFLVEIEMWAARRE